MPVENEYRIRCDDQLPPPYTEVHTWLNSSTYFGHMYYDPRFMEWRGLKTTRLYGGVDILGRWSISHWQALREYPGECKALDLIVLDRAIDAFIADVVRELETQGIIGPFQLPEIPGAFMCAMIDDGSLED